MTFNELNEKAKKRAIKEYREWSERELKLYCSRGDAIDYLMMDKELDFEEDGEAYHEY